MKNASFKQSRRDFLANSVAATGGLAIGMHIPSAVAQKTGVLEGAEVNIWVVVNPDESVVIRYARSEMGQGSMTSAPQLVAEELDVDWRKVRIEYADTNRHVRLKRAWGDMATVGSRTIRTSQDYLRKGGAAARMMLVSAAAQQWGVPPGECTAAGGVITHAASRRRTTYGKVAAAAAKLDPPKDIALKDPKDWKIAGKSLRRIDIPASVNGAQRYGVDTQLPGMVYAAITKSPVFGGKVKSFDDSRVKTRRGIIKVMTVEGDAVAVVADNWWRAKEALKDVQVDWDTGANGGVSSTSLLEFFKAGLAAPEAALLPNRKGDAEKAIAGASKVLEAEYFTPFLAHAPMEPLGATVHIQQGGRVDVWASTQSGEAMLAGVANVLGVPTDNVYFHKTQAGGGFGRRSFPDFARQAALIARSMPVGTPVKLLWSREEDMQQDNYRPLAMYRLKAGIDASGHVVAWTTRIASGSLAAQLLNLPLKNGVDGPATEGFAEFPYEVPNQRHEYIQRRTHVPIGFWRTVGWSQSPFAREGFIDELARAAGRDPYELRREMLKDEKRPLGVLDAAAKAAGWGRPLPKGVFRGIATTEPYGSFTAAVVELSVDGKGGVKLHRVVQAIDCGYAVNPDNIVAQIEGSSVWALTAAMWGEITVKDGRIEQGNFDTYRLLRMREMPKVEVVIAPTGGFWGGVGEPGQAPFIPAMTNAILAATGKPVRSLPLKNQGFTLV
ncbi:MAG: xanthine dehydrogenase family protein molybdopterin-binding subunit [Burkholderiales bacterium]|nr:xanthine dehydrogenase family protein molybdopterin-binding subunit [Burkholderiales bacterium]